MPHDTELFDLLMLDCFNHAVVSPSPYFNIGIVERFKTEVVKAIYADGLLVNLDGLAGANMASGGLQWVSHALQKGLHTATYP